MRESYEQSVEELKRADHLFYVSLKYTRTVDVIKHVLERLISCFEYGSEALLKYAKDKKMVSSIPSNLPLRCEALKKVFPDDSQMLEYINFFFFLRKILRSTYTKREEFRRHVTMIASINNGEVVEVNIDVLKNYYDRTREFVNYLKIKIGDVHNE